MIPVPPLPALYCEDTDFVDLAVTPDGTSSISDIIAVLWAATETQRVGISLRSSLVVAKQAPPEPDNGETVFADFSSKSIR